MDKFVLSSRVESLVAEILREVPPLVDRDGRRLHRRARLSAWMHTAGAGLAIGGAGLLAAEQPLLWGAPWFAGSITLAGLALLAWWRAARSWDAMEASRPLEPAQAARLEELGREFHQVRQVHAEWQAQGRAVRCSDLVRIERVMQSLGTIQTTLAGLRPSSTASRGAAAPEAGVPMTAVGFPTASSPDVAHLASSVAVIPVGSFEQHGAHLPLATDAIIANALADAVSQRLGGLRLPTIAVSCSHEHAAFAGTVSIRAETLAALVRDLVASLRRSGIEWVVLLNAHGGNYVLANLAQELNVDAPRLILGPGKGIWASAAREAGMTSALDDDMHGGEIETSLMLHLAPHLVGSNYKLADHACPQRPLLTLYGMAHYAPRGIIGRPSMATAQKGRRCFDGLVSLICAQVSTIQGR